MFIRAWNIILWFNCTMSSFFVSTVSCLKKVNYSVYKLLHINERYRRNIEIKQTWRMSGNLQYKLQQLKIRFYISFTCFRFGPRLAALCAIVIMMSSDWNQIRSTTSECGPKINMEFLIPLWWTLLWQPSSHSLYWMNQDSRRSLIGTLVMSHSCGSALEVTVVPSYRDTNWNSGPLPSNIVCFYYTY